MKKISIISLSIALLCAMTTTGYATNCPTNGPRTPHIQTYRMYIQNGDSIDDIKDYIMGNFQGNFGCDVGEILNNLPSCPQSQNSNCNGLPAENPFCDYQKSCNPDCEQSIIESPESQPTVQEKPTENKPAEEKPTENSPIVEKPTQEKPIAEKPIAEKPISEKPATSKPSTDNSVTEKPVVSESSANLTADQYVAEVVRLVNIERTKAGLSELTLDAKISAAAYVRSTEQQYLFAHTRPNGTRCFTALTEQGISYRAAGENIAMGQRTPQEVMNGWMNSSGHRANILNKNFKKIGIGYYKLNGTAYWTQLFTN